MKVWKKLPKVFANKIEKSLDNNNNVFYSAKGDDVDVRHDDTSSKDERSLGIIGQNINQKINAIFSSPRYVYKADVNITTKEGKFFKRIIGKNSTHLITIDNELVPITDIIDINFSE